MHLRCFLLVSIAFVSAACQREVPAPTIDPTAVKLAVPQSSVVSPSSTRRTIEIDHPRFRIFKTQNMWTLLLLDTRTGQLWQVQYTIDPKGIRTVVPISTEILADGDEDGRFSLTLTENMWTSILVDTQEGRLWQCQFDIHEDDRFCIRIPQPKENE